MRILGSTPRPKTVVGEGLRTRTAAGARIDEGLRAHMNRVYGFMSGAMLITFVAAYLVGTNQALLYAIYSTPLQWVVMLAPLGVVFFFAAAVNRMSLATAQAVFWGFSALMGVSISYIFAAYTATSIAHTFLITAIAFAGLSLVGYTTKKDLSGLGSFLIMGLIGVIVAMIVNIFLASAALAFAISTIGVLVFAGLTAYDTQRIKNEYAEWHDSETSSKLAIMGALRLYLDFINLFMLLLHFFGDRR